MELSTVRALAAATPVTRNRVVDLLRAAAIVVVVLGHWLMAAVTVRDGALVPGHLLGLASWTHPLTWLFQVMPVFFLVGGYANALSWRSARGRGLPYAGWLRRRLRRLLVPVVPLLAAWLVTATLADLAGVPAAALRTASQVALVPTWFLAAYVVVCALAPATVWLWERLGWGSVVAGSVLAGTVDLVSIGTDTVAVGFANYVVVWATSTSSATPGSTGDSPAPAAGCSSPPRVQWGSWPLVRFGPYPVSMIGLDGAAVNNSYPTRVDAGLPRHAPGGAGARRRAVARPVGAASASLGRVVLLSRPDHDRSTSGTSARWCSVLGVSLLVGGLGLGVEPLSRRSGG